MWLSQKKYEHEVFISHAFEDKGAIADELNARLKNSKVKTWYSGDQLVTGEDLHELIEEAIGQSRFGIIVFSKTFITKDWAKRELNWLESREKDGSKVILPIRHEISIEELAAFSPRIASRVCFDGAKGIDYLVEKVSGEIKRVRTVAIQRKRRRILLTSILAFIAILITGFVSYKIITHKPTAEQINIAIEKRISDLQTIVTNRYVRDLKANGTPIRESQIDSIKKTYNSFKSYFRNEYEFYDGYTTVRGRKKVEDRIGRDVVLMADEPRYGFNSANLYWASLPMGDGFRNAGYSLINNEEVDFTWKGEKTPTGYSVQVHYVNELRFINISFTFPPQSTGIKRHEMTLLGLPSSEIYLFEVGPDDEWHLTKIE
jgi:hypothetical protein